MQSFIFFAVAVIACSSAEPHHASTAHQADMIVPEPAVIKTQGLADLLRIVQKDEDVDQPPVTLPPGHPPVNLAEVRATQRTVGIGAEL